ncbi:hypothetical protein [Cellulomonas phragmiteti]|uniref:hypothetical protein n=1 Tax=Cellulomonas phragmiteti TaxID=478780 RepID=UPI001943407D|nr:hypothetical protein [Cellulomonas phragmiteti]
MDLGVLERTPEAGDVAAVDGLVEGYVARAERFGERAESIRSAGAALGGVVVGEWSLALVERASRLAAGLDDAAGGCRQVAEVLAGYGAALQVVRRQVAECRKVVAAARTRAMAAQERYATAALAAGGVPAWSWMDVPSFPVVPAAADELRVWSDAVDAVVDVPVVQALAGSVSGALDGAQRRLVVRWFVELTDRLVDDPSDVASREVLAGFLEAWGDDPAMTGGLFVAVGGHGTLRLLGALSRTVTPGRPVDNRAVADLAAQVRRGLASASTVWSTEDATTFAAQVESEMTVGDGSVSLVGYLFADRENARMSMAFTVAIADVLDRIERESGVLQDVGPLGYLLAEIPTRGAGDAVRDAAGPVFATLGTYPQAARDWFTGTAAAWPSEGTEFDLDRINYWFRDRDWSVANSDGFAGIASAWAGAQHDVTDPASAGQVASLNSRVFKAVSGNPLLRPEHVSEAGAEALASAATAQLPGLIEMALVHDLTGSSGAWRSMAVPHMGEVTVGVVTPTELGRVLVASAQGEGRVVLERAVTDYQAGALAQALEGSAASGDVLQRLALTWGAADGATQTAQEAVALAAVEEQLRNANAAFKAADGLAGVIPMPPHIALVVDLGLSQLHGRAGQEITESMVVAESPAVGRREYLDAVFLKAIETFQEAGVWTGEGSKDDSHDDRWMVANQYTADYMRSVNSIRGDIASQDVRR